MAFTQYAGYKYKQIKDSDIVKDCLLIDNLTAAADQHYM